MNMMLTASTRFSQSLFGSDNVSFTLFRRSDNSRAEKICKEKKAK